MKASRAGRRCGASSGASRTWCLRRSLLTHRVFLSRLLDTEGPRSGVLRTSPVKGFLETADKSSVPTFPKPPHKVRELSNSKVRTNRSSRWRRPTRRSKPGRLCSLPKRLGVLACVLTPQQAFVWVSLSRVHLLAHLYRRQGGNHGRML
jgi:hypothetical protein